MTVARLQVPAVEATAFVGIVALSAAGVCQAVVTRPWPNETWEEPADLPEAGPDEPRDRPSRKGRP
jgi:hypothetical protein